MIVSRVQKMVMKMFSGDPADFAVATVAMAQTQMAQARDKK